MNIPQTPMIGLPELQILQITFRLQAQKSVDLPPFLGSTLRGAFGTALKEIFCWIPQGVCEIKKKDKSGHEKIIERCNYIKECPYPFIFESPNLLPKEKNHNQLKGVSYLPKPFVLIPPLPKLEYEENIKRKNKVNFNKDYRLNSFSKGKEFKFSILLIGNAISYWSKILTAVRFGAEIGLGNNKTPFRLISACSHNTKGQTIEIFNSKRFDLPEPEIAPVSLSWLSDLRSHIILNEKIYLVSNSLEINLVTPTRLRISDNIKRTISFSALIKKTTERIEHLARLYSDPPIVVDYRPIYSLAENITLKKESFLNKYDYKQFSNRTKRETKRDVILGQLIYEGEGLDYFLPYLTAGELLSIGSNTSYGMGKIFIK